MDCAWGLGHGLEANSCGSMLPSSTNTRLKHAPAQSPILELPDYAVLPRSCMRHLTLKLPELHRRLHQAATPGKAIQRET